MKYWVLMVIFFALVLWIGLIFYFSTRLPVESERQASFVYKLLKKLDTTFDFSNTQFFIKIRTILNKFWFGDRRVTN
ncbi:MAG: hypothetical protein ACK40Q_09000, partial [Pseudothermotoga sp.]